ncbi:hypothetical protein [Streptomyces qinzhouensis]|uniref:Uncharacterized protein n=1 Tax=Streptomyces qinzhouensis TaxID=2599401 RepID=A0A5B8JC59_9ACTN|nr:hypothetical protein [Streptomyces qinzhouensis]QDY79395.1 hypothetical protein FQU76_25925 [Streptomyces qinzhouensis]
MPLPPEESQIHESAQGPRATPAAGRTAPTPRPVPGPRSTASPRPGSPGPARPAPPARTNAPAAQPVAQQNRSQPQIQLIPAPADGALDAADEAVDLLLDSGRAPGDVLVLTTGEHHPWAAHELTFGEAAYWAQHDAGDDVFHADAGAVDRAANRPVVVVAFNGGADDAAARVLPEAIKKATALLIVCGDPQRINAVLGVTV